MSKLSKSKYVTNDSFNRHSEQDDVNFKQMQKEMTEVKSEIKDIKKSLIEINDSIKENRTHHQATETKITELSEAMKPVIEAYSDDKRKTADRMTFISNATKVLVFLITISTFLGIVWAIFKFGVFNAIK